MKTKIPRGRGVTGMAAGFPAFLILLAGACAQEATPAAAPDPLVRAATDENQRALAAGAVVSPEQVSAAAAARARFIKQAHAGGRREVALSEMAVTRAADSRVREYAAQLVAEHRSMAQELAPLLAMPEPDRDTGTDAAMPPDPAAREPATAGQETAANTAGPPRALPVTGTGSASPGEAAAAPPDESGALSTTTDSSGAPSQGLGDRWNRMLEERKQKDLMNKSGRDFDRTYVDLMVDEHREALELFEEGAAATDPAIQAFAKKYLPVLRGQLTQARELAKSLR